MATHGQNTIDRVALELSQNSDVTRNALGAPSSKQLIGPANGTWGRDAGEYRRVAHFPTDGVIKSPPADGIDATIDGRISVTGSLKPLYVIKSSRR